MSDLIEKKGKFGTAPVFLTAISTILGAIMFLRFGWAVGAVGLVGTIGIVIIGHMVTIPTAMALAEIATNQKVEGGGEYFIISRSFGLTIGASIGLALYLSQAISVAFYIIAFTEAFQPIIDWLQADYGFTLSKKAIGLVSIGLLGTLMVTKGANVGMWMLYVVVAILGVSLVMFFAGSTSYQGTESYTFLNNISFFTVFAIVFPAFTGMTAGVGLSGDLKDPKKSIPYGTLSATLIGMVIYIFIAVKLANNASPADLLDGSKQLIMADIAVWSPIILIGLAAATISSALGSIMVAPRTLNAIAQDEVMPMPQVNRWLSKVKKSTNEPVNASLVTCVIAFFFILMGDVNAVAEVISMFFMVTYGSICLISLLENFASNPGYRPSFKSKWYLSLIGAVLCIFLMFKINAIYAILSILLMVSIYITLSKYKESRADMSIIFSGVIFQISRILHVFLQKRVKDENEYWRPSIVALSKSTFDRHTSFDMLRWMSHRIGFGTYIHHIDGYISKETNDKSRDILKRLINYTQLSESSIYVDTLINPSYTASISQILQLPGVSGQENNTVLFEYPKTAKEDLSEIVENLGLIRSVQFDMCVLASSPKEFGYKNEIHLWITSSDYTNATLMIYLAYIILGHPDWKNGLIKLFAIFPVDEMEAQRVKLTELVASGRLPISANNIEIIPVENAKNNKEVIDEKSRDADLTIVGFRYEALRHIGAELFDGYDKIGNILFVNAYKEKEIN
jgi:solute carrier family 12 sodium/potassium/chloride transporter 2